MAKGLFGVRVLEVLWTYLKAARAGQPAAETTTQNPADKGYGRYWVPLGTIALHVGIVGGLAWFGCLAAAASWVIGIGAVFPFLGSVRQLLEHRSEAARPDVDYSRSDQGACTRMFGTGFFAGTFGSAGFNRHLLHHWEPQVSYTRLAELERFLADTPMRQIMDLRRMSYTEAFRRLASLY